MSITETSRRRPVLDPVWTVDDAAELYQLSSWGAGYFAVNPAGAVEVRPDTTPGSGIELLQIVEMLGREGMTPPLLMRFSDILADRLRHLHESFNKAIAENNYRGRFLAVYPIKVNQERRVVQEVFRHGERYGFGLEVGSKPELLAVMALTGSAPERPIICNGFKDDSYIKAVILATKLGRNIIPVIEKASELRLILKHARAFDVRLQVGIRVKLASQGAGRWRDSAGERSKFGLFVSEVLEQLELLRAEGMEDCLTLLHCHPGSQLQDIRRVKDAISELAHVYAELVRLGAGLRYLDIGGGLAVDYDGSRTNYASSMNYSIAEYAGEVIYRIATVCDDKQVEHPTLITESGRAVAAYQSVLVFNVLGSTSLDRFHVGGGFDAQMRADGQAPQPIRDLFDAHDSVSERRLLECYHDALQAREAAQQLFNLGYLSLEARGLSDRLFWATCSKIRDVCRTLQEIPPELSDLDTTLCDTYFCNFSVFQSTPDSWAINQLFPIVPIHRLNEEPTRLANLADITCDSDGRIDRFVNVRDIRRTLAVHELHENEPYYLGVFLVGAYQETLADLHNLFGDTHAVNICLDQQNGWRIDEMVKGDTAAQVLSYVQYDPAELKRVLGHDCEVAVRDGRLTREESLRLRSFYEAELQGYTYLTGK